MAPGPIHLPSRRQALQWVDDTNLVVALPIWLLLALQVRVLSMASFNVSAFAIVVTLKLLDYLDRIQQMVTGHEPFVASMSHELRTPLTTIGLGLNHALRDVDRLSRSQRERLVAAKGELESCRGLLDDLLDISCADSGEIALGVEPTDLVQLCRVRGQAAWGWSNPW